MMTFKNQTLEFSYIRIFTNLRKIPKSLEKFAESTVELPLNLNASPLYIDIEIQCARYTYDSVETIYVSSTDDFVDFKTKLAFIIRYSIWQADAYEPGPFRELLWPGNFIRPAAARALLHDFATWDERARALRDIHFYRTYCTLRKILIRLGKADVSADYLCLAEAFNQFGHVPVPDAITHPPFSDFSKYITSTSLDESDSTRVVATSSYYDSDDI
jgi:hypothetical protein